MARTPVASGRSPGRSVLDAPMMDKRVLIHEVSLFQTCLQLTMIIAGAGWRNIPYFRREARRKPNGTAGGPEQAACGAL